MEKIAIEKSDDRTNIGFWDNLADVKYNNDKDSRDLKNNTFDGRQ